MSENSTNELLIRMEEKYKKMSKGQKRLADYVTENYDKAVFLTAAVNPQLYVLPHSLDTKDIPVSRKHWKNWCATN